MEDTAIAETWGWLDEDFKLDSESPLVISQSLWDDFTQNEEDVRTLFASTPASHVKDSESSVFVFGKRDCPEPSTSGHILHECSPRLKRRRMLQFPGDQIDLGPCLKSPLEEPLESGSDSFIEVCEDFQTHGPSSSSSMWYMANEESLSSVDDAVEQSAESWMAGCFSDSNTRETQEPIPQNQMNVGMPMIAVTEVTEIHVVNRQGCGGEPAQGSSSPAYSRPKLLVETRGRKRAAAGSLSKAQPMTPVAYPFALVKPSGIQGDITLKDINQRIRTPPSRPVPHASRKDSRPLSASGLAFSGKSVVALTKIHTEGKGTITIMRTKN